MLDALKKSFIFIERKKIVYDEYTIILKLIIIILIGKRSRKIL